MRASGHATDAASVKCLPFSAGLYGLRARSSNRLNVGRCALNEPEDGSLWLRLSRRRRDWLSRRRRRSNQQLLDADRLLPDDSKTERPPVTDVFSWLSRRDRP